MTVEDGPCRTIGVEEAELFDWFSHSGCCIHDASNGIRWGIASVSSQTILTDLYISISSLRNSFVSIHSHLCAYLDRHVSFDLVNVCDETEAMKWRLLGVAADMVSDYVEVAGNWDGTVLHVRASLATAADGIEKYRMSCFIRCASKKSVLRGG